MAFECGVCRQTIENWCAAHPEFLDAITRAELASQVWWERAGREGMVADKFNASVWAKSISARFPHDWREVKTQELTGKDGGPIQTEQVQNDADAFTRTIIGMSAGSGAAETSGQPDG